MYIYELALINNVCFSTMLLALCSFEILLLINVCFRHVGLCSPRLKTPHEIIYLQMLLDNAI